ncbi:MAG: hypothetical protein EBR76_01555, partial [Actinobacteria bacterium]|nr:hypothetical protein [Actinomycetota bacterium]
ISKTNTSVHVANTGSKSRELVLQAGGFGEHQFVSVSIDGRSYDINDKHFALTLEPGTVAHLNFTVKRFANNPTYETPWSKRDDWHPLITGRPLSNF